VEVQVLIRPGGAGEAVIECLCWNRSTKASLDNDLEVVPLRTPRMHGDPIALRTFQDFDGGLSEDHQFDL
jgi:hypothetical protein